ncbi:HAAS signaling domain-containing protein [Ornithinibacillus bavariensis]|uniref:Uncharacterized protein n=1 Tax=Ornithinibacillus bavariensis TaxID=545502 RepID=A0A919XAS9_9BACI|nr:hypothetical protein [Ornithinibacillus bavariensis]GIO27260.1 hypothetical protein J43TS3_18710 [Ornithinibacillus bavariensis]
MEMVNRYIYAVTQKLPQSQREDIAAELRSLIEDMLEERAGAGDISDEMVNEVLLELGSPREMAQKYRGTKKYIIGPELYDPFLIVLKIVLISMSVGLGIVFVIESVLDPANILDHFVSFIVTIVTGFPQALGWVTFTFMLIHFGGGLKADELKLEKWDPTKLQPIPHPKKQIKRYEPITGIVFYVIIIVLFAFSSNFFGIYRFSDAGFQQVMPFLNEESFSQYMPFVILLLAIFIVKECLKLISGKWTMKLVAYTAVINIFSLVVVFFIITGPAFWNPNFMMELVQAGLVTEGSEGFRVVESIWVNSTKIIVALFLIGLVWDIVDGFIKARKD